MCLPHLQNSTVSSLHLQTSTDLNKSHLAFCIMAVAYRIAKYSTVTAVFWSMRRGCMWGFLGSNLAQEVCSKQFAVSFCYLNNLIRLDSFIYGL